jgi:hypothetical protein
MPRNNTTKYIIFGGNSPDDLCIRLTSQSRHIEVPCPEKDGKAKSTIHPGAHELASAHLSASSSASAGIRPFPRKVNRFLRFRLSQAISV